MTVQATQAQPAPEARPEQALLTFNVAGLRALIREELRTALEAFTPPAPSSPAPPQYYTREEVAELLHVSQTTLNKWRRAGVLVPVKLGGRTLYPATALEQATKKPRKGR